MRGGRGYIRGGGSTSYGRGGSSSSYRGGSSSSSSFRGGGGSSNYNSGRTTTSSAGGSRYSGGNSSYGGNNNSMYESPRNSRYEDPDRSRTFKRPSYSNNDRDMDDRKRSRYEGGSRGGGSSRRGGPAGNDSFRASSASSDRDYNGGNGGGGGNRYESPRNSNQTGRRSSPGHHHSSSHNHHHNHGGHHQHLSSRPSPASSSYIRGGRDTGGRVRRDSDTMGPPARRMLPPPPPRIGGRGRGRGLSSSTRGLGLRTSIRGRIGRVESTRPVVGLRKRILTTAAIRSRDILRLKTSKMRSLALRKRSRPVNKSDDEDAEEEEEEEEDDEETADLDESAEKENGSGDTSKEDVVGEEDEDTAKGKEEVAENGKKKATVKKEIVENGAEEDGAKEGDAGEGCEKMAEGDAEGTGAPAEIEGAIKKEKPGAEPSPTKKAAKEVKTVSPIRYKSTYIKLSCPHCPKALTKTFKDYTRHLYTEAHRLTLQRVSLKLKHQLLKMRTAQRNAQREADQGEDTENTRSAFCLLCRLNHRQTKAVHNASDGHKNMIRFQRPKCSICRIYFKAPFMYEQHRCSLEHIRNKARAENLRTDDENSDGEVERDLENFTTVDSVGDVDDEDAGDLPETALAADKEEIEDEDINIGIEHVNKVEVHYCDLCRYYFPQKTDDMEERLKRHCQSRAHLRAYLQFKDDELLRQDAERLARKRKPVKRAETATAAAEEKKKKTDGEASKADGEKTTAGVAKIKVENGESAAVKDGAETSEKGDKAAAVKPVKENGKENQEDGDELELTATDEIAQDDEDMDVNDILDRSNYEDDEDSRINSERYDRFRYSSADKGEEDGEDEEESVAATVKKESAA